MILAGLVFYGWWRHSEEDWWLLGTIPGRYCAYLLLFAVVNYGLGAVAAAWRRSGRSTTPIVVVACLVDLGALFWFKYAEWAAGQLNDRVGTDIRFGQIILPIGISFIAFQALGYVIDVHRGDLEPVSLSDFTCYLLFFPHIVAGPLVRVSEFVPQLYQRADPRRVDASRALLLIASGFIKKVVISSYLFKEIVEPVFANPTAYGGFDNLVATYAYAVQIYCDFSGYTDIAIGLALLMGIRFPPNFNNPYRALSMQDFWRRWHMTLSRWLHDYLYIGLGGNRRGERRTYLNLFLVMLIGGLWHGANTTFIVWGALHGIALVARAVLHRPLAAPPRTCWRRLPLVGHLQRRVPRMDLLQRPERRCRPRHDRADPRPAPLRCRSPGTVRQRRRARRHRRSAPVAVRARPCCAPVGGVVLDPPCRLAGNHHRYGDGRLLPVREHRRVHLLPVLMRTPR